jgi:transcriptional regulator with XRE-family HTH domain
MTNLADMTTTDAPKPHVGRNMKRLREMLGIKQEVLAAEMGGDWTQSKISTLEQRETIEKDILGANTFHDFKDNSSAIANNCSFNPLDKVVELYERLLASEKEKVELLKNKGK